MLVFSCLQIHVHIHCICINNVCIIVLSYHCRFIQNITEFNLHTKETLFHFLKLCLLIYVKYLVFCKRNKVNKTKYFPLFLFYFLTEYIIRITKLSTKIFYSYNLNKRFYCNWKYWQSNPYIRQVGANLIFYIQNVITKYDFHF